MNKELVEIKFKEIISRLNAEQQEAVNPVFGPVMVIAPELEKLKFCRQELEIFY